jgi:AhpD family alkylhydroperoxidase
MKQRFDKKIYTARLLFSDIGFLMWNLPKLRSAFKNKQITKAFTEKIMSVTTAVNGCVYCSWFHAKQAVACGISEQEVKDMMNLQFQANANEFELVALLYAQHFAETNRTPDADMTTKLFDYYGDKTANDIILVIRMIFFGNLYGNTWDAVISRFKGRPAKSSNIIFELLFFLLNFIVMIPLMLVVKADK